MLRGARPGCGDGADEAVCYSEGSPVRVVLMGPPGVGKGTQAVRLKSLLGVPHVSTGDILRAAMQDGSALGRQVRGYDDSSWSSGTVAKLVA